MKAIFLAASFCQQSPRSDLSEAILGHTGHLPRDANDCKNVLMRTSASVACHWFMKSFAIHVFSMLVVHIKVRSQDKPVTPLKFVANHERFVNVSRP